MPNHSKVFRIGTRDSQLAVWQAETVQQLLRDAGHDSELVFIKSEGDVDTVTPLYELGVQGIFTKSLDAALLNHRIDLAVHSMKDVPTAMARGIRSAAVLQRASYKDILVYPPSQDPSPFTSGPRTPDDHRRHLIATSSIRRIAQWLHRYPGDRMENLRGNVNTRLRKLSESDWNGAIFAAAGLERIGVRPSHSLDLDWMLPAPAQGAILVVCRTEDEDIAHACRSFHHEPTALCTGIEREFLRTLLGGCSTPISALAQVNGQSLYLEGNVLSPDGRHQASIQKEVSLPEAPGLGARAAEELLRNGGQEVVALIRKKEEDDAQD